MPDSSRASGQGLIRVVLVDDHVLFRELLMDALEVEAGVEVVGEASDGVEAVERCRLLQPDICLLDIEMPRMDGVETTRHLVRECPETKVVILTAYDEDQRIVELVQAGATGYLLKETPLAEVVRAIRVAHSGESLIDPRVAHKILRMLAGISPPPLVSGGGAPARAQERPAAPPSERLTERELEVLREVGRGLNNRELAERLVISEATVKTHVANIMHKLGLRDRVGMVLYAVRSGLFPRDQL